MFLPKTMTMTYKNNVYKNEVSTSMFKSIMISDCNKKQMTMILNYGKDLNIYTTLNEKETKKWLESFPELDYITSYHKEELIGFSCFKHYGVYENLEDGHDVEIIESTDIPIINSNWCNQYHQFKGVLLGYEIQQYGMNMKLTAKSIKQNKSIPDSVFDIPKNHQEVMKLILSNLKPKDVDELIMGQVLASATGQNPARQAAIKAGLPIDKTAYIINQVCGSGLRSVASAYQAIMSND